MNTYCMMIVKLLLLGCSCMAQETDRTVQTETCVSNLQNDREYQGIRNIEQYYTTDPVDCCEVCAYTSGCNAFTWAPSEIYTTETQIKNSGLFYCFLKHINASDSLVYTRGSVSGSLITDGSATPPGPKQTCIRNLQTDRDYAGVGDTASFSGPTHHHYRTYALACCDLCKRNPGCNAFTWAPTIPNRGRYYCFLKNISDTDVAVHANGSYSSRIIIIEDTAIQDPVESCIRTMQADRDYAGIGDTASFSGGGRQHYRNDARECCDLCGMNPGCNAFTWALAGYQGRHYCYLKNISATDITVYVRGSFSGNLIADAEVTSKPKELAPTGIEGIPTTTRVIERLPTTIVDDEDACPGQKLKCWDGSGCIDPGFYGQLLKELQDFSNIQIDPLVVGGYGTGSLTEVNTSFSNLRDGTACFVGPGYMQSAERNAVKRQFVPILYSNFNLFMRKKYTASSFNIVNYFNNQMLILICLVLASNFVVLKFSSFSSYKELIKLPLKIGFILLAVLLNLFSNNLLIQSMAPTIEAPFFDTMGALRQALLSGQYSLVLPRSRGIFTTEVTQKLMDSLNDADRGALQRKIKYIDGGSAEAFNHLATSIENNLISILLVVQIEDDKDTREHCQEITQINGRVLFGDTMAGFYFSRYQNAECAKFREYVQSNLVAIRALFEKTRRRFMTRDNGHIKCSFQGSGNSRSFVVRIRSFIHNPIRVILGNGFGMAVIIFLMEAIVSYIMPYVVAAFNTVIDGQVTTTLRKLSANVEHQDKIRVQPKRDRRLDRILELEEQVKDLQAQLRRESPCEPGSANEVT